MSRGSTSDLCRRLSEQVKNDGASDGSPRDGLVMPPVKYRKVDGWRQRPVGEFGPTTALRRVVVQIGP